VDKRWYALLLVSILIGVPSAPSLAAQILVPKPDKNTADHGDTVRVAVVYQSDQGNNLPLSAELTYDTNRFVFVRYKSREMLMIGNDVSSGTLTIDTSLSGKISGGTVPKQILTLEFQVREDAMYGTAVFKAAVRSAGGGDVIGGWYRDVQPVVPNLDELMR
jgi:hypothetical protein